MQTTSNGLELSIGVFRHSGAQKTPRQVDAGVEVMRDGRRLARWRAHSSSGHFSPSRDAVRKGVDNIASERGLWFKFSREMRALRGLPLEKEREALRPPTQRRVFPSSPPSAAANPAKEGDGGPKNREMKER